MKTKITLGLFAAVFLCSSVLTAQTIMPLYDFETGTTQAGTYNMAWSGAAYLKAFDLQTNPSTSGINTSSKTMRIQEEGAMQWWNNSVQFTLTSPITITSSNRYLHIFHRRPRITAGGFSVNINPDFGNNGGFWGDPEKGNRRFDANLTAIDTWEDVVVDLNALITSSATLAKFAVLVDLNDWNSNAAPLGDYYFDEIILSSSPLPRATTFLTGNNLYDFEAGTTQAGTYNMAWLGAAYLKAFDLLTNPSASGINSSSKTMRIQEEGAMQWWNNSVQFSLTSPITITSSNRYLHIFHRRPRITGGGFSVNINPDFGNNGGFWGDPEKGTRRFDANLTAIDTWQDVVVDLKALITSSATLAKIAVLVDLNDWNSNAAPLGDYYFDEIILSSSSLPRGTTFLTGNNLYDFETGTSANATGINTNSDGGNPVTYPVANPFVIATNLTANVGKRTAGATTNWWTGFEFSFANPVQVDVNHKYLHVMIAVPIDGQKVTFDVKQGETKTIADGVKTISTANTWQDVVLDVSAMSYISGMAIKCGNWDGTAAGDYYFDEIYIDGNASPRVNTATAMQTNSVITAKIYSQNNTICIENNGNDGFAKVYNAKGQIIFAKQIQNSEIIPVRSAGLYFVTIGNYTSKVIVK